MPEKSAMISDRAELQKERGCQDPKVRLPPLNYFCYYDEGKQKEERYGNYRGTSC